MRPKIGWIVAGLLRVLLVFRDAAKTLLARLVQAGINRFEAIFASSRFVRRRSVRRYRANIARLLGTVPVPFRLPVEMPMSGIYIPLRGSRRESPGLDEGSIDLGDALNRFRRMIVLGPPGSGKSLFVRYVAWSRCAGQERAESGTIPVVVPLTRLADEASTIEGEITIELERNGFVRSAGFVERELNRDDSQLIVLFDGLDDLSSARRPAVAAAVSEYSQRHPSARFVVTCRTAVYSGSLDGSVDNLLHVQEFSDEHVDRFLYSWPGMSTREAVDRLTETLRDTPRVAALVRNPLLLTMLAYLYSYEYNEAAGMLPTNRTQFYQDATDLLLRRWQEKLNRYQAPSKKVVLGHIATVYLEQGSKRREMGYESMLATIRDVLPRVNLDPAVANDVLGEIVERSGLLTSLDNGERYQFAHLTLQEYFAAAELTGKPAELLDRFAQDPSTWRESVRLWCGGEQDSTEVIRAAGHRDPVLGLECLADATRVDDEFADELIESMKPMLARAAPSDPIVRAFAVLAADPRSRGQSTFHFLAVGATDPSARLTMATALAKSNLPAAANELGRLSATDASLIPVLESMGNLAVPVLEARAAGGKLEALRSLKIIGTARSAQVLTRMMWHSDPAVACRAALELTQLSEQPGIEDALAELDVPGALVPADDGAWFWRPFVAKRNLTETTRLSRIYARLLAGLEIVDTDELVMVDRPIDRRLVAARLLYRADGQGRSATVDFDDALQEVLANIDLDLDGSGRRRAVFAGHNSRFDVERALSRPTLVDSTLIDSLLSRFEVDGQQAAAWFTHQADQMFVQRVLEVVVPNVRLPRTSWSDVRRPVFDVDRSWYHLVPYYLVVALFAVSAVAGVIRALSSDGWYAAVQWVASGITILGIVYLVVPAWQDMGGTDPLEDCDEAVLCLFFSPLMAFMEITDGPGWSARIDGIILLGFTPAAIYLSLVAMASWLGWVLGTVLVLAVLAVGLAVMAQGTHRDRLSRSPLRNLFALFDLRLANPVIAA